jgi:D-amino peptidase
MERLQHKKILIIADIEGSSGCFDYGASSFMGKGWPKACREMSLDINAVVAALFHARVENVYVKDFHRTGHNLFPRMIDSRATLIQGYAKGPVPGIGNPTDATGLIMVGMHAPSGAEGFLPHTLTSRISRLIVNGRPMSEAQLFSASLAPFGIAPLFFSGCPEACDHVAATIKGISCLAIDKFSRERPFDAVSWREKLATMAVRAIEKSNARAHNPPGPFHAVVTMREGKKAARKIAVQWNFTQKGADLHLDAKNLQELYGMLINLAYLTPFTQKILPLGLPLYNRMGKLGRLWAETHS